VSACLIIVVVSLAPCSARCGTPVDVDGPRRKVSRRGRAPRLSESTDEVQVVILRGKGKCERIGKVPTLCYAKDGAPEKSNAKAWATRQPLSWVTEQLQNPQRRGIALWNKQIRAEVTMLSSGFMIKKRIEAPRNAFPVLEFSCYDSSNFFSCE